MDSTLASFKEDLGVGTKKVTEFFSKAKGNFKSMFTKEDEHKSFENG